MLMKAISYALVSVLLVSVLGIAILPSVYGPEVTQVELNKNIKPKEAPSYSSGSFLPSNTSTISDSVKKSFSVEKILKLESDNMVVMRGPVTGDSVAKWMMQLQAASQRLPKDKPIYLVIDSPGGSVFAGLDLIDYAEALPQPIHTLTLFSASMAFQTVQNLDKRYILRQGTLMSHRARGGLEGQFDGELESRYRMVKRKLDYLDQVAADRMKLSIENYKAMIVNEYWVHGFDAVNEEAADEMVLAKCGKSLEGTEVIEVRTMFGTAKLRFAKCPLIRSPLGMDFAGIQDSRKEYVKEVLNKAFFNRERYVKEFVRTNLYKKVFGE